MSAVIRGETVNPHKTTAKKMARVAVGLSHALVVSDEQLWGCGDNSSSQLGYLSLFKRHSTNMRRFKKTPPVISVCAGSNNTFFIDDQGEAWVCGCNSAGKFGIGNVLINQFVDKPHKIPNLPPLQSIATNDQHTMFLDQEGFVWSCGNNQLGQLGKGDYVARNKPEKIATLPPIQAVGCGRNISMFLDFDGNVWGTGSDPFNLTPIGRKNTRVPSMLEEMAKIKKISVADFHTGFITVENELKLFGDNSWDQLGESKESCIYKAATAENNFQLPPIEDFSCFFAGSMILAKDSSLWRFGNVSFGVWAENKLAEPHPVFTEFASSLNQSIFVCEDRSLVTAGTNEFGCLGLGHTRKNPTPTFHTIPNLFVRDSHPNLKSARTC